MDARLRLPICDSPVGEPQGVALNRSVVKECKVESLETRELPRDMVLGPRLDKIKEEVAEEQSSSRWMRVRRRHRQRVD